MVYGVFDVCNINIALNVSLKNNILKGTLNSSEQTRIFGIPQQEICVYVVSHKGYYLISMSSPTRIWSIITCEHMPTIISFPEPYYFIWIESLIFGS